MIESTALYLTGESMASFDDNIVVLRVARRLRVSGLFCILSGNNARVSCITVTESYIISVSCALIKQQVNKNIPVSKSLSSNFVCKSDIVILYKSR